MGSDFKHSSIIRLDNQDNNFDFLRLFAASAVIFAHSWVVAGQAANEPYVRFPQGVVGGGALGVWMFFCISGYLVTHSFVRRGVFGFLEARALRIFPGLWAALGLGLAVGAVFTDLSLGSYFAHPQAMEYFLRGAVLDIQYKLPTFQQSRVPSEINGSLWTLPVEVELYLLVAVLGLAGLLQKRIFASIALIAGAFVLFYYPPLSSIFPDRSRNYAVAPAICFIIGVVLYLFRDRIKLNLTGSIFLLILALSVGYVQPKFKIILYLAICYWTLWLAFQTAVKVRIPERVGDVSYGLYIYHVPIQASVMQFFPSAAPIEVFIGSMAITFSLAWMSWHMLEKRALALKGRGAALAKRFFSNGRRRQG
ncbi:MAG: acyltransferase [Aeromicrobium sp.]|nr:acyltransferase [Burkholderiales bacterium]